MDSSNGFTYEINEISNKSVPTDLSELKNEVLMLVMNLTILQIGQLIT